MNITATDANNLMSEGKYRKQTEQLDIRSVIYIDNEQDPTIVLGVKCTTAEAEKLRQVIIN